LQDEALAFARGLKERIERTTALTELASTMLQQAGAPAF
jgi:hypothetical protein